MVVEPDCVAYDKAGIPHRVPCPPRESALFGMGHTAYHHVGADESAPAPRPGLVDTIKPALVLGAAYHGYRRNKSILWALGWVVAAKLAPVVTTGVAIAQGYGKPKGG